jgi:hypothetical protein
VVALVGVGVVVGVMAVVVVVDSTLADDAADAAPWKVEINWPS